MKSSKIMVVCGLVSLSAVFYVVFQLSQSTENREAVRADTVAQGGRTPSEKLESNATGRSPTLESSVSKKHRLGRTAGNLESATGQTGQKTNAIKRIVLTEKQLAAMKAVNEWESLVDKLSEMTEKPTKETAKEVKEAFDKLDKKDQQDAIQRAVNLLPDEQFPSLYGILFDKSENADVLDTIFSDGLNRPEDIKVPMMKELVVDKEHPMFFESARILDVTGELDKMSGKTETEAEQNDAMQETAEGETPVGQTVPAADTKATP